MNSTHPDIVITEHTGQDARDKLPIVRDLYVTIYAEPPYCEGADDVRTFSNDWPRRVSAPAFRLVLATHKLKPVGFAFGHQLTPTTPWWDGSTQPLSPDITTEWKGRTFAIIELAVLKEHRRHGIARALHDHLLSGRDEERVTLLVRPEAQPAKTAYKHWGYQELGDIRPFKNAPLYNIMLRPLQPPHD